MFEQRSLPFLDSMYFYLNRAYKAKVPIVMGTDIGSFPWDINEPRELELYVDFVMKAGKVYKRP